MNFKTIFAVGKQEWRRRRSISQDSGNLKSKQNELSGRLGALGQRAWNEQTDIGAFPDIKSSLTAIQTQLDELKQKSDDCRKRIAAQEEDKKQKTEAFNQERRSVEDKKKAADGRLNTEKDLLKSLQKALSQAEGRSGQIVREREQLHNKIVDAATSPEQKAGHQKRLEELAAEETGLLGSRSEHQASIQTQTAKIQPLQAEVDELQKQINDIVNRQRTALAEIDKLLGEIHKELSGLQTQSKDVERSQAEQFRLLGEKLAAAAQPASGLSNEYGAVKESEQAIADIRAKLADLDSQQSETASRAYRQMLTILIGGFLLIAALIVVIVLLLSPKQKTPLEELAQGNLAGAISGLASQAGLDKPQELQEGLNLLQKGMGAVQNTSPDQAGVKAPVASADELKSVLSPVDGWEMTEPAYTRMDFSGIEAASLKTSYQDAQGQTVDLEITDTHSVEILISPSRVLFAMNTTVDDEQVYQSTGKLDGIPMIESFEKETKTARLILVVADRYLINLQTNAQSGLELLKNLAARLNLKSLS